MERYKNFSVDDFLHDESFIRWAKNPAMENAASWENWLDNNPEKREVVENAKQLIQAFKYQPDNVPEDFFDRLKTRIDTSVSNESDKKAKSFSIAAILKLAAVIIGLITGIAILLRTSSKEYFITCKTKYAEIKKVALPDGSEVLLNANSSLRYNYNRNSEDRQVWLEGEAFFYVKHFDGHNNKPLKFVVHAKNLNVEVLGTQFNINNKDVNNTEVLLTKGKVQLSVTDEGIQPILMKPEDFVTYNRKTKNISIKKVSPVNYIAWMDHKYVLEKTTLGEISKELYQYYGTPITFREPKMRDEELSGTLELQDEETLIRTLSTLLGVPVSKAGNEIIIGSR